MGARSPKIRPIQRLSLTETHSNPYPTTFHTFKAMKMNATLLNNAWDSIGKSTVAATKTKASLLKIKNAKDLLSKRKKNKSIKTRIFPNQNKDEMKGRHKLKKFMNMGDNLAFSNQDALPSLASIAMNETHIPSMKT